MKINRFEDLEVWQKARELIKLVHKLTANSKFTRAYGLSDQMRRASFSIMSNIADLVKAPNRPNRLNKPNRLNRPNGLDRPNRLNRRI